MNDLIEQALLFDYYGDLLTTQQKKIYQEVFFDDFSMSEVAEDEQISRQGVHDTIKRTQKLLSEYEEKLGMVKKHFEQIEIADRIALLCDKVLSGDKNAALEIKELCEKIKAD